MPKLDKIISLNALNEQLKIGLTVKIGRLGGRKFLVQNGKRLQKVSFNTILKKALTLKTTDNAQNSVLNELVDKLKTHQAKSNQHIKTLKGVSGFFKRKLTFIKRYFANRGFDRDQAFAKLTGTGTLPVATPSTKTSVPVSTPIKESQATITKDNRRYPPLGFGNRVFFDENEKPFRQGGNPNVFKNHEILEIHPIVEREKLADGDDGQGDGGMFDHKHYITEFYADKTSDGKWVIQQQATRGCTAAVTAMLLKDHGIDFSVEELRSRDLATDTHIIDDIEKAGLQPLMTVMKMDEKKQLDLKDLEQKLKKNGPAIISVGGDISGYVIQIP